ncbi:ASCH domain-containing protein [Halalkalibacterium halodurans]|jgi:ASC-1-like (ASCH) protein|uniref:ASCH domain-containing protein n=1 Tax=Halalkalibacterium halodurans TaxID=86665 RepID=A0A0M0KD18_ALKHA|nr:ASCH domain-containing protein [Halalkalibacterium halodurans]MDY7221315.1 ASCH domain-containing protein [Halalkalibacterium halodurans]MDY7240554.1 ASCH domain-containing protein [Halalkalibacterium halodurans]MED3646528.1 ASCH domain-containing protein [Halalkalibacterium halodurans]MED4122700.1 ASCH domain-containing protein [Halalkalibacterium halodurans]MED4161136.1 ASCH domain-containing protein [Halalkalibacterium halodurans]
MKHAMGLFKVPFESIKAGRKTVEVRLNDAKRRQVAVGDTIEFTKLPEKEETLKVVVTKLRSYDTFEAMYKEIPFEAFDCEGWTMDEMLDGTYEIYTSEQENEWGALAIYVERM